MDITTDKTSFLAIGDLHLRRACPAMRIDDFFQTLERKLEDILYYAEYEYQCAGVIFPGDVFDRPDAPYSLVEWAMQKLWAHDLLYFFVFGQHDLRYHTRDFSNTPLGVLCTGLPGKGHILCADSPLLVQTPNSNVAFWGCSWGDGLPKKAIPGKLNIAVMHRPVTVEKLPWEHKDLITAEELVRACPMDLFITGDNHTQFCADYENASVINLGSVMRTTIAQTKQKPKMAVISLLGEAEYEYTLKKLPIRKNVFDEQAVEEQKEKESQLADFIASLGGEFDPELRFIDNLRMAAKTAPENVRLVIDEVMRLADQ